MKTLGDVLDPRPDVLVGAAGFILVREQLGWKAKLFGHPRRHRHRNGRRELGHDVLVGLFDGETASNDFHFIFNHNLVRHFVIRPLAVKVEEVVFAAEDVFRFVVAVSVALDAFGRVFSDLNALRQNVVDRGRRFDLSFDLTSL